MEKAKTSSPKSSKNSGVFENISYYISLALVFFLPIFFVPIVSTIVWSKTILFSVAVVLMFVFWLVARFKSGSFNLTSKWLFVLAGVPLAYLLASVFSPVTSISMIGLGTEVDTFISILLLFPEKNESALNLFKIHTNEFK